MKMAKPKSVFDREAREEMRTRMARIQPDTRPQWGKMNAGQMLAHVNSALRMALGDLAAQPKPSPLTFPPLRWLVIYKLPWPHGTPTAPELIATPPGEWRAELATFGDLVERLGARGPAGEWPRHPVFGRMSGKLWGDLTYKHADHHLRQFGV